ncbi:MAG: hypothetical protein DRI39_09015 [Chloroflexi bacterium]|nr:MAG: hypothetical protein DRI39_09015 [Chloroflexota bacterium]
MAHLDETVLSWFTAMVGKWSVLDRILILFANDYFPVVAISLVLLYLWFMGKNPVERENNQRALINAAVSIGSACGFVLAFSHLNWHGHPFEEAPELIDNVNRIFYPIHDPAFPSNTSAVTFAAAASVWQRNRQVGLLILVPAILMPVAKLAAAVYYPSDVLAGALLGIATAYFISNLVMPCFEPFVSRVFIVLRRLCLA